MKKSRKLIIGATAAAALVAGGITTLLATAWGDNEGGRPSYTVEQINQGVLGDRIIFNTISNSVIGDEKNFVAARVDDGDHGLDNKWKADEIEAVNGQTYILRIYVHNNNPKGEQAVARNVRTSFSIPGATSKSVEVNGFITSSNASPSEYWDYVRFTSNSNFHLEYIPGSALLENNGIGAGGIKLSDEVIKPEGTLIGYNALDGNIPGCYQYDGFVTVKVKVKYDDMPFSMEKEVRKAGQGTDWKGNWYESINANVGDEVEYRITYDNTTSKVAHNVMVKDLLPNNMEYVPNSTTLYNITHPGGTPYTGDEDTITTTGINIGAYEPNSNAYITLRAKVKDDTLICGDNTLTNWGHITVDGKAYQNPADVVVNRSCHDDFKTKKQVRLGGTGNWQEEVTANVGDEVEYKITYENTGDTTAYGVNVKDTLPNNVQFVSGSAKLYNATKSGETISDDLVKNGVNIGDYTPKQKAEIIFKAKVVDESLVCGDNKLTNSEKTTVGDKAKDSEANVKVKKNCKTDFTTKKQVRIGASNWQPAITGNIGDEVEYRIDYTNIGDTKNTNVNIKDTLPKNVQYIPGSAKLYRGSESQAIADTLVTTGVNIGDYDPQHGAYVTFKVKVVDENLVCGNNKLTNIEKTMVNQLSKQGTADVTVNKHCDTKFTTEKQVRLSGGSDWQKTIAAKIGAEVEYRIDYKNTGDTDMTEVIVKDVLPNNMTFVPGSAKLYRGGDEGKAIADTLMTDGVNIGDYKPDESAYIIFKAKVTDSNLICGNNTLTNTENITVKKLSLQDVADVTVYKDCYTPEPPVNPVGPNIPGVMPSTGPTAIISGIVGAGAVTTAAGYYVASRKQLKK